MKPNEIVRKTRENKGLSLIQLANQIGISRAELRDIEDYDDEIYDQVDLNVIKKIASALGISLFFMLGLKEEKSIIKTKIDRNKIIRSKREEKKMTQKELADIIGYYTEVIEEIENEPDALDHVLPYSEIITLSKTLDIPLSTLIGI